MDFAALLDSLYPGARVTNAAPLVGGVSAQVYQVSFVHADGTAERVVVRRHPNPHGDPARGARAGREHTLLCALQRCGLPTPQSLRFVPPDTLVLSWIDGETTLPHDAELPLAATLAAVHAIVPDSQFPSLPVRDDPLPELLAWQPALFAADETDPGVVGTDGVFAEPLRQACGQYTGTPRLLHGDYWPGNILWHRGRLAAVLDWEDAAVGDPLSDLACARLELCCARDLETAERFTALYAQAAGTDLARLPWWDLYVAVAALRQMDDWGLAPDALAARRAATTAWRTRALQAIRLR